MKYTGKHSKQNESTPEYAAEHGNEQLIRGEELTGTGMVDTENTRKGLNTHVSTESTENGRETAVQTEVNAAANTEHNEHSRLRRLVKHTWGSAFIINLIILAAVIAFTKMSYETNDDYAIAARLADGYPYVGFVNYYLCKAIIAVQRLVPEINVFVISMIAASFAAFTCITHAVFEMGRNKWIRAAAVAAIILFSFDHYAAVQFTKTAALVMTAGMMLLVSCLTEKKNILAYIGAFIMIYLGAAFRVDALPAAAGFAGIYGIAWLISERKRLIPEKYFTVPKIILYILVIALTAGAYGFDKVSSDINISTPELALGEEYSTLRSNIVDFPTYEYYDVNKDKYDAIGISENDLYLIDHWFFDYDGAASIENLRMIDSIERPADSSRTIAGGVKSAVRTVVKGVKGFSSNGVHIILLMCIGIWMIFALRPRHWIYLIATGAFTFCLYAALCYLQRANYRALYVADVGAVFWLLYYMMTMYRKGGREFRLRPAAAVGLAVVVITLMLVMPVYRTSLDKYQSASGKVMSQEVADYFAEHSSDFFVWSTSEKRSAARYATPWLAPDGSDRNVTGTGGWGTMTPYMLDKLAAQGISNPIKDLIDNDRAYYVGSKRIAKLEEYLTRWYAPEGSRIAMEPAAKIDGKKIWKVVTVKQ